MAMEIGTPYDAPYLGPAPGTETARTVGRPTLSPTQRAAADRRYALKEQLLNLLPASTKECKLRIFDAHDYKDAKHSFESVGSILSSEYEQQGFGTEPEQLGAWLDNKYGPGRYCIEAYDPLGNRITDIPAFFIDTEGQQMNDDQEPRGRRRRPMRELDERYNDDDDDDGGGQGSQRVNTPDILSTVARANSVQAMQASKQQTDMFTVMMMQSQTASASKAEEDRRREDREELRAEVRRREAKEERESERLRG